jgi:signal transduction histidine kinase
MTEEQSKEILKVLRSFTPMADLTDEQLMWLVPRIQDVHFKRGDVFSKEGDPANQFYFLVEGDIEYRFDTGTPDERVYIAKPGNIGGRLPFSRLTHWNGTFRAITPGRIFVGSTSVYPEMIHDAPYLVERMVAIMSDRIRYATKEDQQQDRLAALGKLSAGLAHELNNPASAAKRAALALSEAQESLRDATTQLDNQNLTPDQRKAIGVFERQALQHSQAGAVMDTLDQSELEETITGWLKSHGIKDNWKLAPTLAESSLDIDWLTALEKQIGSQILGPALNRIVSQVLARKLTKEIESSTGRISELVKAIKEYSYMDQAPVQEIDIHQGIESTLVMLKYKLKHGITVERLFDKDLPPVCAHGSELNQVWTNLIDNAADAMKNGGTLTIRTSPDPTGVVVEICDTGTGIPDEIQGKIFEPFFTTKKMGEGTGLGLDAVYRIVRKHHGNISVESKPGKTCFQVRLPLKQPTA